MPFDDDDQGSDSEDGKGLRAQLERALARNKELEAKVASHDAKNFLTDKGFDLVKPDDIAGIKPAEWEEAASKVQDARRGEQEGLLRQALERAGIEGDDLEDMVQRTIGERSATSVAAETVSRARSVQGLDSTPTPLVNPEKLTPEQKLAHALAHPPKR